MYLKTILDEFSFKYGFLFPHTDILKDTGIIRNSSTEASDTPMKKNIFAVAALVLMMLFMTACQSREIMTPSPTVPAATIPAENNAGNPIATSAPEATEPASTQTPDSTETLP